MVLRPASIATTCHSPYESDILARQPAFHLTITLGRGRGIDRKREEGELEKTEWYLLSKVQCDTAEPSFSYFDFEMPRKKEKESRRKVGKIEKGAEILKM